MLRMEDRRPRAGDEVLSSCLAALDAVCAMRWAGSLIGRVGDFGRGLMKPPVVRVPPAVVVDVTDEMEAVEWRIEERGPLAVPLVWLWCAEDAVVGLAYKALDLVDEGAVPFAGVDDGLETVGEVGVKGTSVRGALDSAGGLLSSGGPVTADTGDGCDGRSKGGAGDGFDGVIFAAGAIDLVGVGVPFALTGVDLTTGEGDKVSTFPLSTFCASSTACPRAARGDMFSVGGGNAFPPETADSSFGSAGLSSKSASSAAETGLSGFEPESLFPDSFLILLITVSIGGAIVCDCSGTDLGAVGGEDVGSSAIDCERSDTAWWMSVSMLLNAAGASGALALECVCVQCRIRLAMKG